MYMRRHTQSRDSIAVTRGKRVWGWAAWGMSVGATVAVSLHPAAAGPPELMEVIPADAVVAYFLPGPDPAPLVDEPRSVLELAAFVADRAREIRLVAESTVGRRIAVGCVHDAPQRFSRPSLWCVWDTPYVALYPDSVGRV